MRKWRHLWRGIPRLKVVLPLRRPVIGQNPIRVSATPRWLYRRAPIVVFSELEAGLSS